MKGNDSPALASKRSGELEDGHIIISHQQSRHPGMVLVPPVERREVEQQEVERIRGGCCLCPGGGIWVCATGVKEDEEAERAQAQSMQESNAAQSKPSPVIHPTRTESRTTQSSSPSGRRLKKPQRSRPPSQVSQTENDPSARTLAMAASQIQISPPTQPSPSRKSQEHAQPKPTTRKTARSQMMDPIRPELHQTSSQPGREGRMPAKTLPPRARPPALPSYHRPEPRQPVRSLPGPSKPANSR